MLTRQRALVAMLQRAGGIAPKLQFMKWAFLLSEETSSRGGDTFYRFVPYLYGPYSFSLQQEMQGLIRDGFVEGSGDTAWRLTSTGRGASPDIPRQVQQDVSSVLATYGQLSVNELIDTVYARYPWFTINSVYTEKRRQSKPHADLAIYTMGYERLLVDDFLNELLVRGLRVVADVRNNPISRRYGFHKTTLAQLCQNVGLRYYHFPELGIPTEDRQGLQSPAGYRSVFNSYEHETLVREQESVQAIGKLIMAEPTVLICMEADPHSCHRLRLAHALVPLTNLSVIQLGWPR